MIIIFTLLVLLSIPVLLFGIITAIKPFWFVKTRSHAGYIVLAGFCLFMFNVGGAITTTASSNDIKAEKKEETETRKVDLKVEAPEEVPKNQEAFDLKGSTKNATTLEINKGDYTDQLKNGSFEITDFPLKEGENKIVIIAKGKKGVKPAQTTVFVYRKDPEIDLDVDEFIETKQNSTTIKGETEPHAKVSVSGEGTTKADDNGSFSITVKTSEHGEHEFEVTAEKRGFEPNTSSVEVERVQSAAEKKQAYKNKAKAIPYSNLDKNADKYAGDKIKLRGKIMQIEEDGGTGFMLLEVTHMGYGVWRDTVYIEYSGTNDFVKDNVVTVYGEVYGSHSYTSQAGWEISVPAVIAKYIEK